MSFFNVSRNGDGIDRGGNARNGDVDGGEVGDLSVGADAEVGEAVGADVGGGGGVGEVSGEEGIWGEGTVGGLVDDLDAVDVGVVGG